MVARLPLGPGHPVFVVAEIGVNHDGDPARARSLVDAARAAGADAVKFQSFRTHALVRHDAPQAPYQRQRAPQVSQRSMLERLELSADEQSGLAHYCANLGVCFLSTPFDWQSLDDLLALDVAAIKIASGEATNIPFLRRVAAAGRPVILSTGFCTEQEVGAAVDTLRSGGASELVLLQCVSSYPAPAEEYNLRVLESWRRRYGVPVGLSDHTLGWSVAASAVALGACLIEKHFTLNRHATGPDHAMSMEPAGFAELVRVVREVSAALGDGVKRPMASEQPNLVPARRSIVAARKLREGEVLTEEVLALRRPEDGIPASRWDDLVGRRVRRDIEPDVPLAWEDLA